MTKLNPFWLFPWERAFLPDLKLFVESQSAGQAGRALIITPNQRPWRYFARLFAAEKKAQILPKMLTFSEVTALWRANPAIWPDNSGRKAAQFANQLDQVALLFQCAAELAKEDANLSAHFANMTMAEFMPWGLRLAKLLEEIYANGRQAPNLANLDSTEIGNALFASLGKISDAWQAKLVERGWTTEGFDSYIAGSHAAEIPPFLQPAPDRPVFIAGFAALNGAEKNIFKSLWQAGAHICVQGDAKLASGGEYHWACEPLASWAKKWHADFELACQPEPDKTPEYFFFAAYDDHSQLKQMLKDMGARQEASEESQAIVLPTPDPLLALLHHLRSKDLNISMGYPLSRSPLYILIEDIFQMLGHKGPEERYHRDDILRLVDRPFWNMFGDEANGLRGALLKLKAALLRSEERYPDLNDLIDGIARDLSPEQWELLTDWLEIILIRPKTMETPADVGNVLGWLLNFLVANASAAWLSGSLDAEALARARAKVLPTLWHSAPSQEKFALPVLHAILRALMEADRIPFESDPLTALQILGVLETRLLQFDCVYFLNVEDELLPGQRSQDPLLPDYYRPLLGLPDCHLLQEAMTYNFYRLCASAKCVYLYWTEGQPASGVGPGKRSRSRFIEQLLWEREKRQGEILSGNSEIMRAAVSNAAINRKQPEPLARSKELDKAAQKALAGVLSATQLNDYLRCPAKFAYQRLLGLYPAKVPEPESEAPVIGDCIHYTLKRLFEKHKNKHLSSDQLIAELPQVFAEQAAKDNMRDKLAAHEYLYFMLAAPARLKNYLRSMPKDTCVKVLEEDIYTELGLGARKYRFKGKLDRLDEREGKKYILDYKTGSLKNKQARENEQLKKDNETNSGNNNASLLLDQTIWQDDELFASLKQYLGAPEQFSEEEQGELLARVRETGVNPQLPLYMLMVKDAANAALIDLADTGAELMLFGALDESEYAEALEKCRLLIQFLLIHLERSPKFYVNLEHCNYCDYVDCCRTGKKVANP